MWLYLHDRLYSRTCPARLIDQHSYSTVSTAQAPRAFVISINITWKHNTQLKSNIVGQAYWNGVGVTYLGITFRKIITWYLPCVLIIPRMYLELYLKICRFNWMLNIKLMNFHASILSSKFAFYYIYKHCNLILNVCN